MDPLTFTLVNPADAILNGIKMGSGLRQLDDQRTAQQEAQIAAGQMRQDVMAVLSNPGADHRDYAALALKYPTISEPAAKAFKMLSEEKQQNMLNFGSRTYSALLANNPALAAGMLKDRVKIEQDPTEAASLKTLADLIESGPDGVRTARYVLGGSLAGMMGREHFANTFSTVRKEEREEEMQPLAVRKAAADARKTEDENTRANQLHPVALRQAVASADKTEGEVSAQPGAAGLTDVQRRQAEATIEKLSAETRKTLSEIDGAGALEPTKQFQLESDLRKEYATRTQVFQDMREAARRIEASKDDATGDLSLIFGFMKMLDPGSVVREGEFANAQNAAGVPDRILNIYNKVLRGERLSTGQRTMFKGQAQALLKSAEPREKEVRDGIEAIAKSYRLNVDNVFYPHGRKATPGTAPEREKLRDGVRSLVNEFGR